MSGNQKGQCFCGAVEIEVSGEPVAMGYCHCDSCRHWSASPVNAFTLWQPDQVKITKGEDKLAQYNKTGNTDRKWCTLCGGHVIADHPGLNLIDVYAAVIPGVDFKPELHVNYAESVLPMKDGLTKMKDFPADFGGSGDVIEE